jgi:hypothetical protein
MQPKIPQEESSYNGCFFLYLLTMEKIKEIFQNYDSLVFSDGFQSEYEEFYENGFSNEVQVDGIVQKQYFFLSDEA